MGEEEKRFQEFKEFAEEFRRESDRAAVILGAAKLDSLLYLLLTKTLLPNVGEQDELFEGEAPLSSFNAKINLAYRLGLIDTQLSRALHLIRKIRNSFAHEISGCSLNSGAQRDRVRELIAPFDKSEDFEKVKSYLFAKNEPSSDFRMALSVVLIRLESAIRENKPIKEQATCLIPPKWVGEGKTN